ncbi:hypothetical protein EJB05_55854, partial [Eragrostis curvula]
MRSSSALTSRLLMVAAAASTAVALVLAIGLCTAGSDDDGHGRPRPAAPAPVLGVSRRGRVEYDFAGVDVMSGNRDLLGAAEGAAEEEEQDYGYVDPPPDTHRRAGSAPIPHN